MRAVWLFAAWRSSAIAAPGARRNRALEIRRQAAELQSQRPEPHHVANGDEQTYPRKTASYSKGLPHDQRGEVIPAAYASLDRAIASGDPQEFEQISRGSGRPLANPQGGLAFTLEGADPQGLTVRPAPNFDSAEAAAELIELYWQALARDVPFDEFDEDPITQAAAYELSLAEGFTGPGDHSSFPTPSRSRTAAGRPARVVTSDTLFRGNLPGTLQGPYISQFLWKPIPERSGIREQRYRVPLPGSDHMTAYGEWLQIQTGVPPWRVYSFDPVPRYIRNGRDLAESVHYDYSYEEFLNAALILLDYRPESILRSDNFFSETSPYKHSKVQAGWATFGLPQVVDWLARVTTPALKAAWYQKWFVHRRLRPEAFAGRLHHVRAGTASYPIHPSLLRSRALEETAARFGSALLPQAFPEGSPLHPAYPSGHATVAGACATILKALFDENALVPNCVTPTRDGTQLIPCDLAVTVGNELNKLAHNISMGRNFAGIHYRSDAEAGLRLGEQVAISVLQDLILTLPEEINEFRFTSLDGTETLIRRR